MPGGMPPCGRRDAGQRRQDGMRAHSDIRTRHGGGCSRLAEHIVRCGYGGVQLCSALRGHLLRLCPPVVASTAFPSCLPCPAPLLPWPASLLAPLRRNRAVCAIRLSVEWGDRVICGFGIRRIVMFWCLVACAWLLTFWLRKTPQIV